MIRRQAETNYRMMIIMAAVVVSLALLFIWLASAPTIPPAQASERVIPDASIPR